MKPFLFPDINVWVALSWESHVHHRVAKDWFDTLEVGDRLFFCRVTQIGFLRLLTTESVLKSEVMTQAEAWAAYDSWLADERIAFLEEDPDVDVPFRNLTRETRSSPQAWADAYLAAFAIVSRLTLVTFDKSFKEKTPELVLLRP